MSRAAPSLTLSGSRALSGMAGVAVSLALLLQVLVSAPLLMRMASTAWTGGIPVCLTDPAGSHPAGDPALPAPHPDHAQCVLCLVNFLPLVPDGIALPLTSRVAHPTVATPRVTAAPDPRRRFETYASRAPPAPV